MALFGLSITKKTAFRDSTQEFSNVYHYQYTGLNPSTSFADQIIDAIVALERARHGAIVTFVFARLWSAGGSPAANQMIFQKPLTGVGGVANDTAIDKERAILIRWPNGVDARGRPKYLRKWYHTLAGAPFGVTVAAGVTSNSTKFTTAEQTTISNSADAFRAPVVNAQSIGLCSPFGEAAAGAAQAHPYFEHHQFGNQWR